MVLGAIRVRCIGGIVACLSAALCGAAENYAALLDQAIKASDQGKWAEATELLRKAQTLTADDKEIALALERVRGGAITQDETNLSKLVEMAVKGEGLGTPEGAELSMVARQILHKGGEATTRYVRDEAQLADVAKRIFAAKGNDILFLQLLTAAGNKFGQYLAPQYVQRLDNQEPSEKLAAYRALVQLGKDAVIPLIAALDSPSDQAREQIASILGRTGEELAISSLAYLAETDKDEGVRATAKLALERLGAPVGEPAWRLLVNDAVTFLRGTARLPRRNYEPWVWRFKDGKLVGEPVAAFQVGRRIADMLLVRSTRAAAKSLDVLLPWALFTANRAAYVRQHRENLALMKKLGAPEEDVALLDRQAPEVEGLAQSVRLAGLARMAAGLEFALAEFQEMGGGSPAAILELTAEIRDQGPYAAKEARAVTALLACLKAPNQLVRFEAAAALATVRPELDGAAAKDVVDALALAIAQPGARVALLVSPDDDVRSRFMSLLDAEGFFPIPVGDVLRGLAESTSFPPKHVIFFDSNLGEKVDVPAAIRYVRAARGGADIPIVVIARSENERRDRGLYHKPAEKVQVIADNAKRDDLRTQILDPIAKQGQDTRAEGEVRAALAASSLLELCDARVPYDLAAAGKSLLDTVGDVSRPDEVRIPACGCAGYIADRVVLKALTETIKNKERNSVPVRVATLKAIGEVVRRFDLSMEKVSSDLVGGFGDALKACLEDPDREIRAEAARAIGKARWEANALLDIEKAPGLSRR